MGTVPLARSWTLTYRYPSTPNPTSALSRNAGPSVSSTNSLMPPPTTSASNMKRHINWFYNYRKRFQGPCPHCQPMTDLFWFYNPDNSQVSKFDSLTRSPPLLLPVSPIAAAANASVSLPLQLMKVTVLAESSNLLSFSSSSVHSSDVYE